MKFPPIGSPYDSNTSQRVACERYCSQTVTVIRIVVSGVSPATGLTTFTLIPNGASSTAIVFDARIIQPFDELYQFRFGLGDTPAVLAIFNITPLLFSLKCGTKCFAVR